MKLKPNERAWAPKDNPELLLILGPNQQPPRTQEAYLLQAVETLRRLVEDADPEEVEAANNRLRDSLPQEEQMGLPPAMLEDKSTARSLLLQPASLGSRLHELKMEAKSAVKEEPMDQEEANQEAAEMSLESFLSRLT